eukprot:TRINITY_DN789_c0_g1_i2.p1 TRINITY_DN789_c0_g1~~TRINITY_DN789_c0_g1_i2.p1  ORF type:complete len:159 (+),score=27.75 TRINITY_DN789_c0_g1_i2:163-639(+)
MEVAHSSFFILHSSVSFSIQLAERHQYNSRNAINTINSESREDKNFWLQNPPSSHRPPGRPKKNRVRGDDEQPSSQIRVQSSKRCGNCNMGGHNCRRCKEPLANTNPDNSQSQNRAVVGRGAAGGIGATSDCGAAAARGGAGGLKAGASSGASGGHSF